MLLYETNTGGFLKENNREKFWFDRPVLVTGATGLLGSWLVKHLISSGADVTAIIRDWVPQSELVLAGDLERIKVVRGDILQQPVLERTIGEYEIDTVFHLAAQTIVNVANRNPVGTFDTNISGTCRVLEACRRSETVKQIIVASSDKAYGDRETLPYEENVPLEGRHPYDVSKSCVDLIAQSYWITYKVPVCITRCGNFYGGGDLNWNRLVPGTIRSALRGIAPVVRSDGSYIRDYFYIEDAAVAYMMLAERMGSNRSILGEAYNFSNELQMTVLELVKKILDSIGRPDLEPEMRNEASNEIVAQYLSAKKAKDQLGWTPRFTLEEGLDLTVSWYKKFLGCTGVRTGDRSESG